MTSFIIGFLALIIGVVGGMGGGTLINIVSMNNVCSVKTVSCGGISLQGFMKFSQNPELREFLLSTGDDILVEASPYDAIWGIRMSVNDENATNPMKWRGRNLLGFALMEARDEIRRVWANAGLCEEIQEDWR